MTRARLSRLAACLVAAAVPWGGCDFSPSLDIETPEPVEAAVLRSVLTAGEPVLMRVSVSRDPYQAVEARFVERPTRIDARVTLLRDGAVVETLQPQPQTCYRRQASTCNPETGRVETTREEPFECGAHRGTVPVEAGATYALRVEVPGLETAQATVAVPSYPAATGQRGAAGLGLDLSDPPGLGNRYGLTLRREFDRYPASVCARGGRRDTTIVLGAAFPYESAFATRDPILLTTTREAGASVRFATFPDDAFDGRTHAFALDPDPGAVAPGDTGALRLQVSALSAVLYEAYVQSQSVAAENPFAEPVDLPTNVTGGYGLVGAVAVTEIRLPHPDG